MYEIAFPDGGRPDRLNILVNAVGQVQMLMGLRLRDAWVEKSGEEDAVIAIYTRNGGGNRECYCEDTCQDGPTVGCEGCIACRAIAVDDHPALINARDDSFDSTYRTYRFRIGNPEVRNLLAQLAVEPVDTDDRWKKCIDALKSL